MIKEVSRNPINNDDYIEFFISYTDRYSRLSGYVTQTKIQRWCINNIEKQCSVYGEYGDIYVLFHNDESGAAYFKETMEYYSWLRLMGLYETYNTKLI